MFGLSDQVKWRVGEVWVTNLGQWWAKRPAGCLLTFCSCEHKSISKHYLVLSEAGTPHFEGTDHPVWSHASVFVWKGLENVHAVSLNDCPELKGPTIGSPAAPAGGLKLGVLGEGTVSPNQEQKGPQWDDKRAKVEKPMVGRGTVRPHAWVGLLLLSKDPPGGKVGGY